MHGELHWNHRLPPNSNLLLINYLSSSLARNQPILLVSIGRGARTLPQRHNNNLCWITDYLYFSFRLWSRIVCVSASLSTRLNLVSWLGPRLPCLFLPPPWVLNFKNNFCSGDAMLQNGLNLHKKVNGASQSILDRLVSFYPQRSSFNLSYSSGIFFQQNWYIFRDRVINQLKSNAR